MIKETTLWDIPPRVREANGMRFDHEENEYFVFHGVNCLNLPSDCKITQFDDKDDVIYIEYPFMKVTLYKTMPPHITVFNHSNREWVR